MMLLGLIEPPPDGQRGYRVRVDTLALGLAVGDPCAVQVGPDVYAATVIKTGVLRVLWGHDVAKSGRVVEVLVRRRS